MSFADAITIFRLILSPILLWLTPDSMPFVTVYLLCGVSDILDGFVARRMNVASERGAKLDSLADAVFAVVWAIKILPLLTLPRWLWYWIAGIFAVKITGIAVRRRAALPHTRANKVTGLLLWLAPLLSIWIDVQYLAVPICTVASTAAMQELLPLEKNG